MIYFLVFANINISTAKPETISCRILALIPLIEDAKRLYFIAVQSLHYLHLHTTYGIIQQLESRLIKLFPGLRNFFIKCKTTSILDGKVWIPQIPNIPPKFSKTTEPPRTLLHSISEQPTPSASYKPTIKRNVSSRIAALQKSVVIPGNKPDIETKPLPPIPRPSSSTSNNRKVYEDDENIYEELNLGEADQQDDEYFTDSDFDTTDDEDDENCVEAAQYKFNEHYESGDGEVDPRTMLQRVLLLGVQKEVERLPIENNNEVHKTNTCHFPAVPPKPIKEEVYAVSVSNFSSPAPKDRSSSVSYEICGESSVQVVDVADLMSQLKVLEQKVENLRRNNDLLTNQNNLLRKENVRLKNYNTTKELPSATTSCAESNSQQKITDVEPNSFECTSPFLNKLGQRRNLRESVMFFESIQN